MKEYQRTNSIERAREFTSGSTKKTCEKPARVLNLLCLTNTGQTAGTGACEGSVWREANGQMHVCSD